MMNDKFNNVINQIDKWNEVYCKSAIDCESLSSKYEYFHGISTGLEKAKALILNEFQNNDQIEKEYQRYIFQLNDILRILLVDNCEDIQEPVNTECYEWWCKTRKGHQEIDDEIYNIMEER